ncbi:MAG: class I SAM-dependent methyltransferase [Chloroflexota bacterium]|nr:class I SAM-dependent methyltransferase [Chloroflexota bacterium]
MDKQKRRVQQQFGAAANAYVESETHAVGADLERVAELVAEVPVRRRALDVATGGGHTARTIAPFFDRVIFMDLTSSMLQAANAALRRAGITKADAVQGDAEAFPFADAAFDLVTCRVAPHHFPYPSRFVEEATRVLRPGGRFILVESIVPNDPKVASWLNRVDKIRDPSHVRTLSATEWLDMVSDTRLTIRGHHTYHKRHALQEWLDRANANQEQRDLVHDALLSASPDIRAAYRLEYDSEGVPLAFTDEKVLIWADKLIRSR